MSTATRAEVYAAIDSERDYQEMRKARDSGAEFHSIEEFLLYMKVYLDETLSISAHTWGPEAGPKTLEHLRKVTALGVSCMEQHGAPHRVMLPVAERGDPGPDAIRPAQHSKDCAWMNPHPFTPVSCTCGLAQRGGIEHHGHDRNIPGH